jgi:hypothetical protein
MMKNIISSPYRKMKILLILPVFAIVLYAFAKPDYKYKNADQNQGSSTTPASVPQHEIRGKVVDKDGALPGASVIVLNTNQGTSTDDEGLFKLSNIPEDGTLVVSFVGYKSKVLKPVFNTDMVVTMIKDTLKFLKGNISTPPPPPPPPMKEIEENSGAAPQPSPIPPINGIEENSSVPPPPPPPPPAGLGIGMEGENQPMVVIDGVVSEKEKFKKINPDDIKTVSVFKDDYATKKYGDKGKNGVIEVTTYKDGEKRPEAKAVSPSELKPVNKPSSSVDVP